MTEAPVVAELTRRIAEGDPTVVAALAALPSRCVHDAELLTPFAAAIRHDHTQAIELLLEDEEACTYRPLLDDEVAKHVRRIASFGEGPNVEATERYVLGSNALPFPYWQRTPLQDACRHGRTRVLEALVVAGASLVDKDALGLTALDLCLDAEDEALVESLVTSCVGAGRTLRVSADQLEAVARRPRLWSLLLEHGRLAAPAKRLAFNVACARLDLDLVRGMIEEGYDPASAVSVERHPAVEAANSGLVWSLGLPEFAELAAGFAHMYGHPDSLSMTDADLFDEEGRPISFGEAERRRKRRNEALKRSEPSPTFVPDAQLERRLTLLELLSQGDLGPGKYRGEVVTEVIATNRPELIPPLRALGFSFGPTDGSADISWALLSGCYAMVDALIANGHALGREAKSHREAYSAYQAWRATRDPVVAEAGDVGIPERRVEAELPEVTWELAGESMLIARLAASPVAGESATVRVTHANVYGPVDGVALFVRVGDPDEPTPHGALESTEGWTEARVVEETVLVGDEEIPRAQAEEPFFDETPWECVYEAVLLLPLGRIAIEIALVSEKYRELSGVVSDWVLDVK